MGRLLGPNEAKFWLMGIGAPMNTVIVLRCHERIAADSLRCPGPFALPRIVQDANERPRWDSPCGDGLVSEESGGPLAWLATAQRLGAQALGVPGAPVWHAVVLQEAHCSTLVFAVHHALADYRAGLWLAHCFLTGQAPGPLAPACEELLAPSAYGQADAEDLISQWWRASMGARWHALGVARLASLLPGPGQASLARRCLTADDTQALLARCRLEQTSLNGAVAVALRQARPGTTLVAHSVDMSGMIDPALENGPGLAVSHVLTGVDAGQFWPSARAVRAALFDGINTGSAGDALLALPRALLHGPKAVQEMGADICITGAPRALRSGHLYQRYAMYLVLGSSRAGGDIVFLSFDGACLQLVLSGRADTNEATLEALASSLHAAIA